MFENQLRINSVTAMSLVSPFLEHGVKLKLGLICVTQEA